jgi:hypothetical protein
MSLFGFLNMGSSLSVRSLARFGKAIEAIGNIRLFNYNRSKTVDPAHPDDSKTSLTLELKAIEEHKATISMPDVNGADRRVLSIETSDLSFGGTLHGLWHSDEVIASSDRTMKVDIANLEDYAGRCQTPECRQASRTSLLHRLKPRGKRGSEPVRSLFPILQELRPVVYRYKDGATGLGKNQVRFGFVADELEQLVPDVVRTTTKEGQSKKGVVYQDLIALLAAGMREHQGRLEAVERQHSSSEQTTAEAETALQAELQSVRKELQELKDAASQSESASASISLQSENQRLATELAALRQKVAAIELQTALQLQQQQKAQMSDVLRQGPGGAGKGSDETAAGLAQLARRMDQQESKLNQQESKLDQQESKLNLQESIIQQQESKLNLQKEINKQLESITQQQESKLNLEKEINMEQARKLQQITENCDCAQEKRQV